MLPNQTSQIKWSKIAPFLIACIFVIYSIFSKRIEFAVLAALTMFFTFSNFKRKTIFKINNPYLNKYEISPDQLVLSLTLLFYSVILGGVAVYLSPKVTTGIIALILWIISIGLLITAGIVFDKFKFVSWKARIKKLNPNSRKSLFVEISIVLIITTIAFALRAINLDKFPTAMHGDEGEIGMEALRFLGVGEPTSPFNFGWGSGPNIYFLIKSGFIFIFGRNLVGLRMMSAVFGTACIPIVYLIGKKCWGKIAGVVGAWLIAVSHFQIQYSRIGIGCIEPVFLVLLFFYLFLKTNHNDLADQENTNGKIDDSKFSNKTYSLSPYILLGITAGFAQYFYIGARLIPVVALPLILVQLLRKQINLTQIVVLGFSAIMVFAPLGFHYLQHPNDFSTRMNTVSIFNPDNVRHNFGPDATLSNSLLKIIGKQLNDNLSFFLQSGDRSSFYFTNIPAFDPISAVLFWLGLGIVASRSRRLPELTMILWFALGIFFGGLITNDSPSGSRLIITTSTFFIIAGVFIQRTWDGIINVYKRMPNTHLTLGWLLSPAILAFFIGTLMINYNFNFVIYPKAGINILSINIAKEINNDATNNHVYLLGDGDLYANHGTIRFLTGDGKVKNLLQLNELPPLEKDGKGITILATYSNFDQVTTLQSLYPQGIMSDQYRDGYLIFKKFQILAQP